MGKHLLAECDKGVSRDVLEMPPAWHVTLAPSARDAPDLSLEEWENNVKGLCVKFMEGTRVRSVTRTDAGTVLILTQPVIADPERTGANKPILESRPVCGDFTYLVLKPILACKEQPKLIFADLFKLWRHQPILWHCCEDKAYAIFLQSCPNSRALVSARQKFWAVLELASCSQTARDNLHLQDSFRSIGLLFGSRGHGGVDTSSSRVTCS